MGIGWGSSGGEAAAALKERYLAADGIENVIRVLEDLEDEKFYDLDFVELNACSGGCVGGVLGVENPYVAKAKLKRIANTAPSPATTSRRRASPPTPGTRRSNTSRCSNWTRTSEPRWKR